MEEVLVPLAFFLSLFAIVAIVSYYRFRTRQEAMITVRSALDSGQPLSSEVINELSTMLHDKRNDLRRGMVFVAIGLAIVTLALSADELPVGEVLGVSAFPFFVGIAYLLLWYLAQNEKSRRSSS